MRVDFTRFALEAADQGNTGRAGPSGASGMDNARFRFDQRWLLSLQAQVLAQPEIRGNKVQSLQEAIDKGEYAIPASLVADALVGELSGARG